MCNLCKGLNPHCRNCSTMGISNEFDNYKPVYLLEPKILFDNKIDLIIEKKQGLLNHGHKVIIDFKSKNNENNIISLFKKEVKKNRKIRDENRIRNKKFYPKLSDKYGELFLHLKKQINN